MGTTIMQKNNFLVVVFGTPSDRRGVQFKVLNEDIELSFNEKDKLDTFNPKTMQRGSSYKIIRAKINNIDSVMVVEYRKIKPIEENSDRGAYIAVGVIIKDKISINTSIIFFQILGEIHAHLSSLRDGKESFNDSFKLEEYRYTPPNRTLDLDSAYLVDTLCKASSGSDILFNGVEVIYNSEDFLDKTISSENFFYIKPNLKNLKIIEIWDKIINERNEKIQKLNKRIDELNNSLDILQNSSESATLAPSIARLKPSFPSVTRSLMKKNILFYIKQYFNSENFFKFVTVILAISTIVAFSIIYDKNNKLEENKKSIEILKKSENNLTQELKRKKEFFNSPYHKDNPFLTSTWYVYSRILELKDEQYKDIQNKIKDEFKKNPKDKYNSKKWKELLGLNSLGKIPKEKDRKQGILAIWECSIDKSKKGHIGFVEEILDNNRRYRLSDFDRFGKKEKNDNNYTFPSKNSIKDKNTTEGYLSKKGSGSCFPIFYSLEKEQK